MARYTAEIIWQRGDQEFTDNKYSRRHTLRFDGGAEVPASSSPHVVKLPYSDASAVDPEEMLVAALSSCHMLSFLYIAGKAGFRVDSYRDMAEGIMEKNPEGKLAITVVTLHPEVAFEGRQPSNEEHHHMHHQAHEACFIASSVKTDVRCEPILTAP